MNSRTILGDIGTGSLVSISHDTNHLIVERTVPSAKVSFHLDNNDRLILAQALLKDVNLDHTAADEVTIKRLADIRNTAAAAIETLFNRTKKLVEKVRAANVMGEPS